MKSNSFIFGRSLLQGAMFLYILFISNYTLAQPYMVYPTLADTNVTSVNTNVDLNNAVIDYSPNCSNPGGCGIAQLKGIAWDQSPAQFSISDGYSTVITNIFCNGKNGHIPDIALGNCTSDPTAYMVAVTFLDDNQYTGFSIYKVSNVGTGMLTVDSVFSQLIDSGGSSDLTGQGPRIDVIAEYGNLFPIGGHKQLPLCNSFVIAYARNLGGPYVNGYASTFNNPSTGTMQSISSSNAEMPDVAAIQRTGVHSGVDNIALFAFNDNGNLGYEEWNITQGTTSAITDWDSYGLNPRIDAIDNYNINSGSIAQWCITQNQNDYDYNVYNNLTSYGGITIYPPFSSFYRLFPCVAAGPDTLYSIGYTFLVSDPLVGTWTHYILQTINVNTGQLNNANFYGINYDTSAFEELSMGVSATCNNSTSNQKILCNWRNLNSIGSSSDIMEKTTGTSLAFKSASVPRVNSITWSVFPNPSTNFVTLSMPSGTQPIGYSYRINDVTGRVVLEGDITQTDQRIDLENLVSGIYVVNIFSSDQNVKVIKLTKE